MIVEADAKLPSAENAFFALHLAGIEISSRHVQRIAKGVADEMARRRDHKAARFRRRALPVRVAAGPEAVAVEVDGGRLRTREVGCGPGVHQQQNQEGKVACLVSLHGAVHEADPQPEPPESFLEPRRVQRLVQQMQGMSADKPAEEPEQEEAAPPAPVEAESPERPPSPRRLVRTCVASMAASHSFGLMVAAEAQERAFSQAKRGCFLGDGAAYNWWIQRAYFPDFVAIADFLLRSIAFAFGTPSVRAVTFAEIAPEAAACPAAYRFAALIVEDSTAVGTPADGTCGGSTAANAPTPDTATPRRVRRFASIVLALANHPATVPSGTPSCRAACVRVLPSRSHRTMTARYLWGRRLSSSSSRGWRSRQRSCSATAGSGISVTCLSRPFLLAAVPLAFKAV
jgi:hypothetical protein